MSILADAGFREPSLLVIWLTVFAAAAAVGVAWLLGVLRARRTGIGSRVGGRMMPLVGVLFSAAVVWVVTPSLYLRPRPAPGGQTAPASGLCIIETSPRDLVIVNCVVPVLALVVLASGDAIVRPVSQQRIGYEIRRLPRGFVAGLAGILLALPLVYCSMMVSEWIYRRIGYEHASEHDLLKVMGQTPDVLVKTLAILAAVLVAPLWEEMLFRGHIQTLVRETLIRIRDNATDDWPSLELPHPIESWAAIVLTSLLFGSVHALWTFPPIFVLSLCLGFAYERTGNLWTSITMHASFNTLMTVYFLYQVAPR